MMVLLLTGCSNDYIKINESETEAIAQYCAHLLLKYDGNKLDDNRLMDYDDLLKELDARKPEEPVTPIEEEPLVTEEPQLTEEPSEVPDDGTESDGDNNVPEDYVFPTEAPTPTPVPIYTLAEVIGCNKYFNLEYDTTVFTEEYQSDSEYFSLKAPEGKKIAAVTFKLTNTSKKEKTYEAANYSVKYKLTCDNDSNYDPALSLLAEDLQFYNESIGSGETKETVVIFFVPADVMPRTLKVTGTDSSSQTKSCTINISNNSEVENGN